MVRIVTSVKQNIRIAICGYAGVGKSTVSTWLGDNTLLRYKESTSAKACTVVFHVLAGKYGYRFPIECWEDRENHREEWYDIIQDYNGPKGDRLHIEMLKENDVLDGIRKFQELAACQLRGHVDLSIWIDRPGFFEDERSCRIAAKDCDIIMLNDAGKSSLDRKLKRLCTGLGIYQCKEDTTVRGQSCVSWAMNYLRGIFLGAGLKPCDLFSKRKKT